MEHQQFFIEINVTGKHASVECDGRMPFMLADAIKDVVKKFYNEDTTGNAGND